MGLVATRRDVDDVPHASDLHDMGTVCRIHRIHREEDQLQVLLEGLQRFQVRRWIQPGAAAARQRSVFSTARRDPLRGAEGIRGRHHQHHQGADAAEPALRRGAQGLPRPLQPQRAVAADRFRRRLTSASKEDLQEVLETMPCSGAWRRCWCCCTRRSRSPRLQMRDPRAGRGADPGPPARVLPARAAQGHPEGARASPRTTRPPKSTSSTRAWSN